MKILEFKSSKKKKANVTLGTKSLPDSFSKQRLPEFPTVSEVGVLCSLCSFEDI